MTRRDRVFLGIDIPDDVRHRLAAQLEQLVKRRLIPGKRVPIDNWHMTLRFIGPATEVEQERILAYLDEAELGGPVRIRLEGMGAFPRPAKAAVLWLGVTEGTERLADVAAECEAAVVSAGLPPEDRPFHAHVTLSRVRPPVDVRRFVENFDASAAFTATDLKLFRSIPAHRKPMRYEVVETVGLQVDS